MLILGGSLYKNVSDKLAFLSNGGLCSNFEEADPLKTAFDISWMRLVIRLVFISCRN